MKNLVFTVTNELVYDQRMIRICSSLAAAGYQVTLIGRCDRRSAKLVSRPFNQKRLTCFFSRGKLFYLEFNIRLFFSLLFCKSDLICAIDLDTILPVYLVSRLRGKLRVYDAHELFCEMQEIVTRPAIYRAWKWLEKRFVPEFPLGYTVNQPIADELQTMYKVNYQVIRSISVLESLTIPEKPERYILYQGAVNIGRSFDTLIAAMELVDAKLIICGDGNYLEQANALVLRHNLSDKVIFYGKLMPSDLKEITRKAWIGITLFENIGLSNYFSLANRFFDYLHAGIPQVCVDYPVYRELNNTMPFAVLINDLSPVTIAAAINRLLQDDAFYSSLQKNCLIMRQHLNWQEEQKKLVAFYQQVSLNA